MKIERDFVITADEAEEYCINNNIVYMIEKPSFYESNEKEYFSNIIYILYDKSFVYVIHTEYEICSKKENNTLYKNFYLRSGLYDEYFNDILDKIENKNMDGEYLKSFNVKW